MVISVEGYTNQESLYARSKPQFGHSGWRTDFGQSCFCEKRCRNDLISFGKMLLLWMIV